MRSSWGLPSRRVARSLGDGPPFHPVARGAANAARTGSGMRRGRPLSVDTNAHVVTTRRSSRSSSARTMRVRRSDVAPPHAGDERRGHERLARERGAEVIDLVPPHDEYRAQRDVRRVIEADRRRVRARRLERVAEPRQVRHAARARRCRSRARRSDSSWTLGSLTCAEGKPPRVRLHTAVCDRPDDR